ncbi:MAG: HAD-IB family phosphatase [Alphaproteobacteria bacterium]|nr:HAD-IB family phosphatase [Alphaproteobacteria bacterium]
MLKKTDVVLFDFDGTLSAYDANYEFGKYCFRHSFRPWLFLPLVLVGAIASLFNPDGIWWRQTMRRFLNEKMVKKHAAKFIKQHKRNRFGWSKERVQSERDAGRKVVLLSASPNYLLRPLVRDMNFDAVFCSEMDPKKPWKYNVLCWKQKKVYIMDEWAKENKIIPNVVRAYSDSKSDLPMMEIAEEQVWIDPKTGMRK